MGKVYYIVMKAETCCDYWDMDVLAYGITESDAKLSARQKFVESFGREPNAIYAYGGVDIDELKPNFINIISQYNDTK